MVQKAGSAHSSGEPEVQTHTRVPAALPWRTRRGARCTRGWAFRRQAEPCSAPGRPGDPREQPVRTNKGCLMPVDPRRKKKKYLTTWRVKKRKLKDT